MASHPVACILTGIAAEGLGPEVAARLSAGERRGRRTRLSRKVRINAHSHPPPRGRDLPHGAAAAVARHCQQQCQRRQRHSCSRAMPRPDGRRRQQPQHAVSRRRGRLPWRHRLAHGRPRGQRDLQRRCAAGGLRLRHNAGGAAARAGRAEERLGRRRAGVPARPTGARRPYRQPGEQAKTL